MDDFDIIKEIYSQLTLASWLFPHEEAGAACTMGVVDVNKTIKINLYE